MKSKKIIYLISGLIILLLFYLVFLASSSFRVNSYSPTLNNITTITPYIDIYFSKTISQSDLSISSPENIVSKSIIESPKDIRVYLIYPLNDSQKYKIILNKIVSTTGSVINLKTVSFTPLYKNPNSIPKSQIKYIVSHQDKPTAQIYGTTLVNLLPYISPGFSFTINYNIVNNTPTIIITSATSSGVSAAKSWIVNQGYTISSLNIEVVNQQPV